MKFPPATNYTLRLRLQKDYFLLFTFISAVLSAGPFAMAPSLLKRWQTSSYYRNQADGGREDVTIIASSIDRQLRLAKLLNDMTSTEGDRNLLLKGRRIVCDDDATAVTCHGRGRHYEPTFVTSRTLLSSSHECRAITVRSHIISSFESRIRSVVPSIRCPSTTINDTLMTRRPVGAGSSFGPPTDRSSLLSNR